MKNTAQKRILQLAQINERARTAPGELVAEENRRYREDLEALAAFLAESDDGRRLTMLSGPSSSGKTTTALLLRDSLRARGLDAHVVSLDNVYRGRCCAPSPRPRRNRGRAWGCRHGRGRAAAFPSWIRPRRRCVESAIRCARPSACAARAQAGARTYPSFRGADRAAQPRPDRRARRFSPARCRTRWA